MSPFTPVVFYRDPLAALKWLEQAFGFETSMLVTDAAGAVGHAEMSFAGGKVGVGGEWSSPEFLGPAAMKSPASMGGAGSQFIRVAFQEGIDEHCARARAAGARITQPPTDQFYGARVYRALDLEGHVWCFDQPIAAPSIPEMERPAA
ncbi:MAG: glyoxalase [Caulobacteraceae bacterium]|nr:glyoxalase [Caulobacteraceae bacterium]